MNVCRKIGLVMVFGEKNAKGKTVVLDLLRMVDIARVRYIKIKGNATPHGHYYNIVLCNAEQGKQYPCTNQ
jgi:hypothetical protein